MVGAPNVTKEAGIPDWGGRLYLRIQDAMNRAAITTTRAIAAGSVAMAAKLTTARTIAITGDMAWSVSFDGSANVTAAGTLATVNANVGTFGSASAVPVVTVNAKGLVTAVTTAGLGTAAVQNTGTSGANVPLLNAENTWGATQTVANPSGHNQLNINQTVPASFNADIGFLKSGTQKWVASARFTGSGDFWLFNSGRASADLIVSESTGDITGSRNFIATTSYLVGANQVVGSRKTGWGAASGTLSRAAYAAYAGQTYTGSYVQATAQATDNAIKLLSQTVAALITDLTSHGLIGP